MQANSELTDLVSRALAEDLGSGDITSEATVPAEATSRASLLQKQPGVLFGLDAAREAFAQAGAESFEPLLGEGEWRSEVPAAVARIEGPARALLGAERVALNLLGHLSGVATLSARFVDAVEGTGARILDTRKTTPGLRSLEKAAVTAGGATNHRRGLDDAILIKENHAALAGGLAAAVREARAAHPELPIEAECRDLDELADAIDAGATRLLLDNMSVEELTAAVSAARRAAPQVELEASGGVSLENVREVAGSGVDFVSVGALTHSAPALDVSMLLEPHRP
jgi:nicotinate-nucleotide pyrophosphorylase (carboxylating)